MELEYNLKSVANWLLTNGYGVLVNDEFVITRKLNAELFQRGTEIETMDIPLDFTDRKAVWNAFILNAEIPHRVNSSIGVYTVRQYNLAAANRLMSILKDPTIDNEVFVSSTKNYYKAIAGKTTLSKYLASELWKWEYEEWLKNPRETVNDGSSRWED